MTIQSQPAEGSSAQEPTSNSNVSTNQKGRRSRKAEQVDQRVPVTISVTAEFARKLRIVVSTLDESAGAYVESRLSAVVKKDLKKILEEMG